MKRLLFYIIVLICFNQLAFGGDIEIQYDQFDSLLFEGKFDLLQNDLENYDKNNLTIDDNVSFQNKLNKYFQIINYKDNFIEQDQTVLLNFIKYKKAERRFFSESFAGTKASTCYEKFLQNSEKDNHYETVKYYFIANYFRSNFIDAAIDSIRIVYKQVQEKYKETKYIEVLNHIQANQIDPGNNYILKSYHDSLMLLSEDATKQQTAIDDNEFYWKRKNIVNKNWYLSIGLHSVFQPTHENITFDFLDQNPPFIYNKGYVTNHNSAGFSCELLYQLNDNIYVGGDFMMSKFKYKSELDLNTIYFDYNYDYLSTHLTTQFLLRKYVGIRPYIGIGFGYFRANRSESEVKVISYIQNNYYTNSYTLSQETITTFQTLFDYGFQFIFHENSKLFFNIKSTIYKNLKEDPSLKSNYKSVSVHFGLLL